MVVHNKTKISINAALQEAVMEYPTEDLVVEVKYCPKGSRRYASGTYYRRTKGYEAGKFIRIRINRTNRYPLKVSFKTSEYFKKRNSLGELVTYQRLRRVEIGTPEDLLLAIFLHEFSHYLDHVQGLKGTYKETKADKFALSVLERLEVIPRKH